jgi:hypothetical protein
MHDKSDVMWMTNVQNKIPIPIPMGGFRNYWLCRSEKLNATENNTQIMDFNSVEEISWEA